MYDLLGALASLVSTYFFIRQDPKAWVVSLLAIVMNSWLYWEKGIYADTCLEAFYFFTTCYGWYRWSLHQYEPKNVPKYLTSYQWLYLLLAIVVIYGVVFNLLRTFSNSNVALLDALTTSLSLCAQWLMCHKIMATWVLWFFTDALYAVMYGYKNLPFHTLLMLVYTGMAIAGYILWAKQRYADCSRHTPAQSA